MIGSLGSIVFETSSFKVRTFNDIKRSGSARWTKLEVIGAKPVQQFLGPDCDQVSFTMRLDISLGINPKQELIKLRLLRDSGAELLFILNGRRVGASKWIIKSLDESWLKVDNKGRILVARVDISIEEVGDN